MTDVLNPLLCQQPPTIDPSLTTTKGPDPSWVIQSNYIPEAYNKYSYIVTFIYLEIILFFYSLRHCFWHSESSFVCFK